MAGHVSPECLSGCTCGVRYVRVGLSVPLLGSLAGLRRAVADEGRLAPEQVGYHHSLPSSPFNSGPEGQRLLPPSGTLSSEFLNQGGGPARILLLVCNMAQEVRFGPPFLMREDRSISWDQLQQSILSKLYYLMINGAQAQNARVLFNIRVVGGASSSVPYSYLSPQDGRPLYHPAVERQQQQHVQQLSCSLDDCFQLYTKEEQLAPDDAWLCPHCRQRQQGVVKMSLWTLPDILILHLKRFRQVAAHRNKLTTLVSFPLAGLDMAPHVVKRSRGLSPAPPRPTPPPTCMTPPPPATSFCRNSVDGRWYGYDDTSAEPTPPGELVTRGAYILFYQRRNATPPWSAASSSSVSTQHQSLHHPSLHPPPP
ncbi:hypothetical protein CRUP_002810 [Coryphaenoides rupestris]|nr:hypothetical protein CRUP_002810 [Coryphaenoides rupestris]